MLTLNIDVERKGSVPLRPGKNYSKIKILFIVWSQYFNFYMKKLLYNVKY